MRKKQTWFIRLITTYLPILYLLTVALLFVFFMTVNQLSQRQTVRANEAFTKYALQRLDSLLGNIDQIVNTDIVSNRELAAYTFMKNDEELNPYLLGSKVSDRFHQLKISFPQIYSIYFYRHADMSVLSTDAFQPLSRFGDQAFLQEQMSKPFTSQWSAARTYKDFDTQEYGVPVVSLVKKVPLFMSPSGVIVINFDLASLQAWIGEQTAGAISYVKLYDAQGQLLAASKEAGSSDLLILTSNVTGWSLHSGLNPNYQYGMFTDLYYSWLILGAVMVLLASVGTIYLSKRYARPIDASLNRISEFFNGKPMGQPGKEVLQYVDSAVDQIIDYANRYQSESVSQLPYRQKHFFQELLSGDREIGAEEMREEMQLFGFSSAWTTYSVALLEIDRMTEFTKGYSYRDQYLLKFVLTNALKETAEQQGIEVWSEWLSADTLGILFGQPEQLQPEQVLAVSTSMKQWIESNLTFTVTIGVGAVTLCMEEIRLSYDQAAKALEYKSALGNNKIIDYLTISRRTETELFDMLQLMRNMIQLFKNGDDNWRNQLEFMFSMIGKGLYSHDEMINLFHYMNYTLMRELEDFPNEYKDIWKQQAMPSISQALESFDTLEDLRTSLLESLNRVAEKWKSLRESRNHRSLMQQVKSFIEEQYGNPNLSLQLISDEFKLSKNYLSRLFKDEFRENFIDYVTNIRMQKAKELMDGTDLSIQDIALQVGYEHYFTFNRAFKKSMGFPPSDYRKRSMSE